MPSSLVDESHSNGGSGLAREGTPRWRIVVAMVGLAAILVPYLFSDRSPEARATQQTFQAFSQARGKLAPLEIVRVSDLQRYVAELKRIEVAGTPEDVRQALANYIAVIEEFLEGRDPATEVDWVDAALDEALIEFENAVTRHKGQAF